MHHARPTTTNRNRAQRRRSGASPGATSARCGRHLPRCEQVIEPASTLSVLLGSQCIGSVRRPARRSIGFPRGCVCCAQSMPKYACRTCEGPIVQAKAPARLVEGGMATTALIADFATAKYAWQSTPLSSGADPGGARRRRGPSDAGALDGERGMDGERPLRSATEDHASI